MKKMTVVLFLLLAGMFIWAQQPSSSSSEQSAPNSEQSKNDYGSRRVQGCLVGSTGNYLLKQDDTGATVKVSGDEGKLKNHVGHEVLVVGVVTGNSIPTDSAQSGQSNSSQPNIEVAQVTEIANICAAGAMNSDLRR